MDNKDNNMRIVMVGAGNVATHIAVALAGCGVPPIQVWSRTLGSARVLADMVGSQATNDIDALTPDADVYIVSVADNALADVIKRLSAGHRQGVFVHTAGTMPMSLFDGLHNHYGVLYPMQTFSKQKALDFKAIPCFIEASNESSLAVVEKLADMLSDNVRELSGADRKWLHVAAVFACNFANACCAMAAQVLQKHGIDFDVLLPLVDETTNKLHHLAPVDAQTGPAVRCDRNVMSRHLQMLADDRQLEEVYRMMSDVIMSQHNRKDDKTANSDDKL